VATGASMSISAISLRRVGGQNETNSRQDGLGNPQEKGGFNVKKKEREEEEVGNAGSGGSAARRNFQRQEGSDETKEGGAQPDTNWNHKDQ